MKSYKIMAGVLALASLAAVNTPAEDFYLLDKTGRMVYNGKIENISKISNDGVTVNGFNQKDNLVFFGGLDDINRMINGYVPEFNAWGTQGPNLIRTSLGADPWQRIILLGVDHYSQYFVNEPKYENQTCQVNEDWIYNWWWDAQYSYISFTNGCINLTKNVEGYNNFCQAARVMRVWAFSRLTDYFGDIPYTEADNVAHYLPAKYDTQEFIYTEMLRELAEASAAFTDDANDIIGESDPFFKGDVAKWRAFANSMRLRLAMRLSEVDPAKAQAEAEAAVAAPGGLMQENVTVWKERSLYDSTIYGYNQFYPLPHYWDKNLAMSKSMQKILTGLGGIAVVKPEGVTEPESSYTTWTSAKAPLVNWNSDSIPQYVDPRGLIMFDVTSPGTLASYERKRVNGKWNYFADFRGRWQGVPAGLPKDVAVTQNYSVTNNSRLGSFFVTPQKPSRYLTSDDVPSSQDLIDAEAREQVFMYANEMLFLKAEGALRGWNMGGTAKEFYEAGIRASMATYGNLISAETVDAYLLSKDKNLSGTSVAFDDFDAEGRNSQLYKIMTQKYLAGFPENGYEAWNDYRRTGMPALDAMTGAAKGSVLEVGAPDWKGSFRRFSYPQDEKKAHGEEAQKAIDRLGGTDATWARMWWDARTTVVE